MDIISGDGVREEKALELGYIAIVPDALLEPDTNEDTATDLQMRRQYAQDWENSNPKEYKVIVLDKSNGLMNKLQTMLKYLTPRSTTSKPLKTLTDDDSNSGPTFALAAGICGGPTSTR